MFMAIDKGRLATLPKKVSHASALTTLLHRLFTQPMQDARAFAPKD
jgi:hypothetical protein